MFIIITRPGAECVVYYGLIWMWSFRCKAQVVSKAKMKFFKTDVVCMRCVHSSSWSFLFGMYLAHLACRRQQTGMTLSEGEKNTTLTSMRFSFCKLFLMCLPATTMSSWSYLFPSVPWRLPSMFDCLNSYRGCLGTPSPLPNGMHSCSLRSWATNGAFYGNTMGRTCADCTVNPGAMIPALCLGNVFSFSVDVNRFLFQAGHLNLVSVLGLGLPSVEDDPQKLAAHAVWRQIYTGELGTPLQLSTSTFCQCQLGDFLAFLLSFGGSPKTGSLRLLGLAFEILSQMGPQLEDMIRRHLFFLVFVPFCKYSDTMVCSGAGQCVMPCKKNCLWSDSASVTGAKMLWMTSTMRSKEILVKMMVLFEGMFWQA